MWEIKTEAPSEIRGPLQPISTSVPGIQICELFPEIAKRMDRSEIAVAGLLKRGLRGLRKRFVDSP